MTTLADHTLHGEQVPLFEPPTVASDDRQRLKQEIKALLSEGVVEDPAKLVRRIQDLLVTVSDTVVKT